MELFRKWHPGEPLSGQVQYVFRYNKIIRPAVYWQFRILFAAFPHFREQSTPIRLPLSNIIANGLDGAAVPFSRSQGPIDNASTGVTSAPKHAGSWLLLG